MFRALAGLALAASLASPAVAHQPELPVGNCINMGNHLEAFPTEGSWRGKRIEATDFARIRAAGFETVRIPVRWLNKSGAEPPHAIDPAWLERVGEVVDWALAADLKVLLNSHHFESVHENPAAAQDHLAAVWAQIAAYFAGRPDDRLWFEIENEPHDRFTNALIVPTLSPALAEIRKVSPDRPVIIGGENWSGIDSLATLDMPDDPHVYPTFHYYEPFDFTHQGASWVEADFPLGREYGREADRERLVRDVAKVRAYVARTGKVPFMGETGAHTTVPLSDRIAYHRAVRDAFAGEVSGICAWGYTNTFEFWDQEQGEWLPGLLEAFLHREGYQSPAGE
ncbi:MAG TPA: glycoside hydrolase family 5 protein [Sphingomonadaceae bacterium]|nr:glycoside hydrolase family 5 protein [Sphingomonadaceae bacterium]